MPIFLPLITVLILLSGCFSQPTPQERKWLYAGISLKNKKIWDLYGIGLDEVLDWRRYKFPIRKAMPWLTQGFKPVEAKAWRDFGFYASDAKAWRELNITYKDYPNWEALHIPIEEVRRWKKLDLPYYAVALLKEIKFTPKRTKVYLSQEFHAYPRVYREYNSRIYNFSKVCDRLSQQKNYTITGIQQQCNAYKTRVEKSKVFGHILDMKNNTKSLKIYINQLRDLKFSKDEMQRNMAVKIDQSIAKNDIKFFSFLFPLLDTVPRKQEMAFIETHHLDFNDNKRYQSYEDIDFWIAKAQKEYRIQKRLEKEKKRRKKAAERARKEAILLAKERRQRALSKARRLKHERIERLAFQKCGPALSADSSFGETVQLFGNIAFVVGEKGRSTFGYGVQSLHNSGVYYVRDPKGKIKIKPNTPVRLIVKKLRRLAGLKIIEKSARALYDPRSDTMYEMALYIKPCTIKEKR